MWHRFEWAGAGPGRRPGPLFPRFLGRSPPSPRPPFPIGTVSRKIRAPLFMRVRSSRRIGRRFVFLPPRRLGSLARSGTPDGNRRTRTGRILDPGCLRAPPGSADCQAPHLSIFGNRVNGWYPGTAHVRSEPAMKTPCRMQEGPPRGVVGGHGQRRSRADSGPFHRLAVSGFLRAPSVSASGRRETRPPYRFPESPYQFPDGPERVGAAAATRASPS